MNLSDIRMINHPDVEYKWDQFHAYPEAHRNYRLPPEKKYVLVKLKSVSDIYPSPIVVGYLKYHAGEKSEPYFVTPGATISGSNDNRVIAWCDCLPKECETMLWNKPS